MALNPLPIHLSMHPRKLLVLLFIISTVCILNSCGCHKPRKVGYIPAIVPKFQLTQEGGKNIEISDSEAVKLCLEEVDLVTKNQGKKVKFKIKQLDLSMGELFIEGKYANRLVGQEVKNPYELIKLEVGTEFFLSASGADSRLPIVFKPSGAIGGAKIVITLEAENQKEGSAEYKIGVSPFNVTLLSKFKSRGHFYLGEINQEQLTIATITKDFYQEYADEVFTIKSIESKYGELVFQGGNRLAVGDRLKLGNYPFLFSIANGSTDIFAKGEDYIDSELVLTLTDSKGLEYVLRKQFKVKNPKWKVGETNLNWENDRNYRRAVFNDISEFLSQNFIELSLNISFDRQVPCYYDPLFDSDDPLSEFANNFCRIVDCRSSDGSPVTLVDMRGRNMLGQKIRIGDNDLYFRLEETLLNTTTTLILNLEGPDGRQEEVCVEVPAKQSYDFLQRKIFELFDCVAEANKTVVNYLQDSEVYLDVLSSLDRRQVRYIKNLSEKASVPLQLLSGYIGLYSTQKDVLAKLDPIVIANLKNLLEAGELLENNLAKLNSYLQLPVD
jgi:hypothetical protein